MKEVSTLLELIFLLSAVEDEEVEKKNKGKFLLAPRICVLNRLNYFRVSGMMNIFILLFMKIFKYSEQDAHYLTKTEFVIKEGDLCGG